MAKSCQQSTLVDLHNLRAEVYRFVLLNSMFYDK